MSRLTKEMKVALNDAEESLLLNWEKWLTGIFENLPKPNAYLIASYTLPNPGEMGKLLTNHSRSMFTLGQAHGMVEVQKIIDKYERKLADPAPDILDSFQNIWIQPSKEALQVLNAKEMVLAGDVEAQVLTQVKQVLVDMLMGVPRKDVEEKIQQFLSSNRNRASLITTTETTYAYNRGRLNYFSNSNNVDYLEFVAIMDKRTSVQCSSRHGLIMAIDDPRLPANTPPLHGHCRSILIPRMSRYQKINQSKLDWSTVAPLPKGWRTA